jgi:hypothetical protein
MTKLEMDKLLAAPAALLGHTDRQRQALLRSALAGRQCIHPDCAAQPNQIEACEQGLEGYRVGSASTTNTFRCPRCSTALDIVVPILGGANPGWHWGRVRK